MDSVVLSSILFDKILKWYESMFKSASYIFYIKATVFDNNGSYTECPVGLIEFANYF